MILPLKLSYYKVVSFFDDEGSSMNYFRQFLVYFLSTDPPFGPSFPDEDCVVYQQQGHEEG